ncbi:MAG TPA: 4a-hydroxytetrahydrobiopterin dehydratase [Pirellulaceae bacterium]|nr:4a-hydroxytetrahydrobiopterin dehydratase [Pirellulaceae bacterium]
MKVQNATDLAKKKCVPCEGGAEPLWPQEAQRQLAKLPGWSLGRAGQRIGKTWVCKDFAAAMKFLNAIAKLAEQQDHHPDLHLTGYRQVEVEIYTHAVGGLSENDFILAAKIDRLPVEIKKPKKKK